MKQKILKLFVQVVFLIVSYIRISVLIIVDKIVIIVKYYLISILSILNVFNAIMLYTISRKVLIKMIQQCVKNVLYFVKLVNQEIYHK